MGEFIAGSFFRQRPPARASRRHGGTGDTPISRRPSIDCNVEKISECLTDVYLPQSITAVAVGKTLAQHHSRLRWLSQPG
jgi:hypothetical protein